MTDTADGADAAAITCKQCGGALVANGEETSFLYVRELGHETLMDEGWKRGDGGLLNLRLGCEKCAGPCGYHLNAEGVCVEGDLPDGDDMGNLEWAARQVVDSWENGDVAAGVRALAGALEVIDEEDVCVEGGAPDGDDEETAPELVTVHIYEDVEFNAVVPEGVGLVIVSDDPDCPHEDGEKYTVRVWDSGRADEVEEEVMAVARAEHKLMKPCKPDTG